ncbi:TonB-dependent receptor [Caulobacter sp.]|uniref:TonB-dependent receptor domain-containing protein n=1 Tax=Caulobacter sp. TaxID=78 RepID=UPI00160DFA98
MTSKGYRAGLMACATFALGAWAPQAIAAENTQGAPAEEQAAVRQGVTSLDEVIVTARRRDERLIDAPVAITAMGGKALEAYSVTRVSDLATMVPSLIAGKAASGSSASIFLRGVGSTALSAGFDQSVSFVMDGLPMSRGRELSLPQFDVQRVEVLKGPQALFYGKNTTGGLISIVTNGPTATPEAGVKAGYGFKARERYVEGYVSGPLADTLRARLAGRYSKSDGAFANSAAETYTDPLGMQRHRNAKRRGGQEVFSVRGALDWDASENLTFQLKAGLTDLKDGGPTDVLERICGAGRTTPFSANGIPPSPNADCKINGVADSSSIPTQVAQANYRYARDGRMYADFGSQFGALTSNLTLGQFGITSITSYYHFKQTDLNNVSGEAYPATFSQLADFEQFAEEIRVQSKFDGPFNVLFGAFYSKGDFDFNTDAYIFPVPLDPSSGTYATFKRDNGFKSESYSFFGEGTFNISPELELAGGARWSHESRDSYQRSLPAHIAFAGAFPGGIRFTDKFEDDNLSPQVSVRYKPETDTTIYAAYKQGFKSGGFNISQALSPTASVDAGRFGSETAEGGEIGLRTIQFGHDLQFNVTAFQYTYKDLQVQTFDPQSVSLIADNAGKLRTRGVEADVNYRVSGVPGLSLRGAAAYNDVQYIDYVGQCYSGQTVAQGCNQQLVAGAFTAQDYNGRTPPKAPKFAGRVGASYERDVASNLTLRMSGDVSRTSKYNFTDTLRPDGWQPGYTKVDASISVSGPDNRWTLALIGKNLTNELVVTSANDIPFAGGTGTGTTTGVLADMSAFVENPREILVELSLKF